MRPRIVTPRNIALLLVAVSIFFGLAVWGSRGFPLPFGNVPSTAGKIVFVSNRSGKHNDLWMMNAKDGGDAIALTDDTPSDGEATFSPAGDRIAFTSNRPGVVRQLCVINAQAGAGVSPLTNTSSYKEQPEIGADGRIYFLDAGKVSSANTDTGAFLALFPTAEMLRSTLKDIFSSGGLQQLALSPNAQRIACVLKMEKGEALFVYEPEKETLLLLGTGERVRADFARDGTLYATFAQGSPTEKPFLLMNESSHKHSENDGHDHSEPSAGEGGTLPSLDIALPQIIFPDTNLLVKFASDGSVEQGLPFPSGFLPDAIMVAPDGKKAAVAYHGAKEQAGLARVPLSETSGAFQPITLKSVEGFSWSPDSSQIAFGSDGDIFTAPETGGEPTNLTKGKGRNSNPIWSPAVATGNKP